MARRRYGFLALSLAFSILLSGCAWRPLGPDASRQGQGAPTEAEQPRDGGILRIGLWTPPKGVFNPLFATDAGDREINALLFDSLLRPGPDLSLRANLARSFIVSPDQKTILFQLRDDVRWHDGRPLTAKDVVFTFRTVLSKDYKGPYRGELQSLSDVSGPDDQTVLFTLAKPYGPALTRIGLLPILPQHRFEGTEVKKMAEAPASRQTPVGTGPFKLVSLTPRPAGDVVELARHDRFFRGRPHLEQVIFAVIAPKMTVAALRKGAVDLLRLQPAAARPVRRSAGHLIQSWPADGYFYLGMNLNYAPFNSQQVRQALAYGLDRQAMLEKLFSGQGTLINAPVLPGSWAEAQDLNPYAYDPRKAGQLLREAGYSDTNGDGRLDRNSKPLEMNLLYLKGKPVHGQLASLIQKDLKRLGIQVYIYPLEQKDLLVRVFRKKTFDLYLLDWQMGPDPDTREVFGQGTLGNAVSFNHPRGQDLLARGTALVDPAERRKVYQEWIRLANTDLPYVFLFTENRLLALDQRVRGLEVTSLGYAGSPEKWWVIR